MLAKFFVALFKQNQCSSCKGNLLVQLKSMSTSKWFVANIFTIKYVVKKFSIKRKNCLIPKIFYSLYTWFTLTTFLSICVALRDLVPSVVALCDLVPVSG